MSFRPSSRGGRLQIPEPPSDDEPIAVPRGPRRTARQTTRHAIASRRTDRAVTQHQGFSHYDDEDWTEEVEEFDGTEYTSRPLADDGGVHDHINDPSAGGVTSDEDDDLVDTGVGMLDEGGGMALDLMDEDQQEVRDDEHEEHQIDIDQIPVTIFDARSMGLKEINNLGRCRVSTYKPGNGVAELLSDDLDKYWQSDGVQPHRLTYKFIRMVEIRAIRFYVDYNLDESYTPTHIVWQMGTGEHDLIKFAESRLTNPVGWQEVQIAGCGGGDDGDSLCCFVVQMHIKENHQNGKDTHIRALKIYGYDEHADPGHVDPVEEMSQRLDSARTGADDASDDLLQMELERRHLGQSLHVSAGLDALDFAEDPIIR